jgi:hypothetical protein
MFAKNFRHEGLCAAVNNRSPGSTVQSPESRAKNRVDVYFLRCRYLRIVTAITVGQPKIITNKLPKPPVMSTE